MWSVVELAWDLFGGNAAGGVALTLLAWLVTRASHGSGWAWRAPWRRRRRRPMSFADQSAPLVVWGVVVSSDGAVCVCAVDQAPAEARRLGPLAVARRGRLGREMRALRSRLVYH